MYAKNTSAVLAKHAVVAERCDGVEVRRMDRVRDGRDEDDHRDDLHHDQHPVNAGRFAYADGDERGHRQRYQAGEDVHLRMGGVDVRRLRPRRKDDADVREHVLKVVGERRGRGRERKAVLEDQIPADHPRDEFAERRVRVRIRAARDRDHGGKLRVAERDAEAHEPREHVCDDDARAGSVRARADRREDAAEHRPQTDRGERRPSQDAAQRRPRRLGGRPAQRLPGEELSQSAPARQDYFFTQSSCSAARAAGFDWPAAGRTYSAK